LLELIMATMILSIMMLLSFFCFDATVQSWQAGVEMSDSLGQADYVMEQLVSGLRSAYYPDTGAQLDDYGFQFVDGGEGPGARDYISWVKIGRALVGEDCKFAESPHRINLSVEDGGKGDASGLTVRAWRVDLQLDDFDPEKVAPVTLSPRVTGFNCRMLDKDHPEKDKEPNWQDEWTYSNCIPKAVEITLYMESAKEREKPLEVKRIVEIPLFDLSQKPRNKSSSTTRTGSTTTTGGTTGHTGSRTGNSTTQPIMPRSGGVRMMPGQ